MSCLESREDGRWAGLKTGVTQALCGLFKRSCKAAASEFVFDLSLPTYFPPREKEIQPWMENRRCLAIIFQLTFSPFFFFVEEIPERVLVVKPVSSSSGFLPLLWYGISVGKIRMSSSDYQTGTMTGTSLISVTCCILQVIYLNTCRSCLRSSGLKIALSW